MTHVIAKPLTLLLGFAAVTVLALFRFENHILPSRPIVQTEEALYLPNGKALNFISFGYHNALSQLLWFNTISYFGKHYRQDQSYRWLKHMCTLVTTLNPNNETPFTFCAAMLAWEAHDVVGSNEILTRAIQADPHNWYFRYLRGFNYTYFLKDQENALLDFLAASKIPGHHPLVARLAAKKLAELDTPETAIEFLEEALNRTNDTNARRALLSRLHEIKSTASNIEKKGARGDE